MSMIHMTIEDGRKHLEFWCDVYHPYQFYYPKEPYLKGEAPCIHCCIAQDGFLYRAPFKCERIASSTPLSRFCIFRGDPTFFHSHPADIPVKIAQRYSDLFGWLYGSKIETKRKPKEKIVKTSTERKDNNRASGGSSPGLLQENPEREIINIAVSQVEQPQGKQGNLGNDTSRTNCRGLPGLPEAILMQQIVRDVFGENNGEPLQPVRNQDDVPVDRQPAVGIVPGVQRKVIMKEEYDQSYDETTAHSCITCKCGIKVWYGCGVKQLTRPKYCTACEKIERSRITESYKDRVDSHELHRILEWELRRGINR